MTDPLASLPRLGRLHLTAADVVTRLWQYGVSGEWPAGRHVRFNGDGSIGGWVGDPRCTWRLDGGTLALQDDADCRLLTFDEVAIAPDGRLVLRSAGVPGGDGRGRTLQEMEPLSAIRASDPKLDIITKSSAGSRRYLVVLRANEASLHTQWARDIDESDRTWDLFVSFYGQPENFGRDEFAEYQCLQREERKFGSIYHLFWAGSPLWNYDWIFLPEDDLMMSWRDLNRMFSMCRRHDLQLGGPTLDGHVNQPITRPDPDFELRYVSFIEAIAPIFSNAALRTCVPTFNGAVTGYGLDHIWPKLLGERREKIAMFDEIVITHTRPGNSPTSSYDYEAALTEGWQLQQRYDAAWHTVEFGGLRRGERDRHGDWASAKQFEVGPPPKLWPC